VAISAGVPVGLDVEVLDRRLPVDDLAPLVLAPPELRLGGEPDRQGGRP
jgi:hypothetical protein